MGILSQLLLLTAPVAQAGCLGGAPVRATWVWETREQLAPEGRAKLFAFLKERGVNAVYLHVDVDLAPSAYREFIAEAGRRGITVHALGGAPNWGRADERRSSAFFDWVARYQREAGEGERFKGLHLDVEPHASKRWHTARDEVVADYKRFVGNASTRAREMKLRLELDVPFWFDTPLVDWVLKRVDGVTVMAYRERAEGPNGAIELASRTVRRAEKAGKDAVVAVEAVPRELGKLLGAVSEEYCGVAVHDYETWRGVKDPGASARAVEPGRAKRTSSRDAK